MPCKVATADRQRRETASLAPVDPGAHQAEWHRHPFHRPLGNGGVALEYRQAVDSRDEPGKQADPGARIAHVQEVLGLVQAVGATVDVQLRAHPFGPRPEGDHRLQGVTDVLAVRQPSDPRAPFRPSGNQQGPVRDRLVPGRPQPALERPPARRLGHQHGTRHGAVGL